MKKLLIVVDYQNDFVTGSLGCGKMAEDLYDGIVKRIKEVENSGGQVLFTLDIHGDEYRSTEEGKLFAPHCIRGTVGAQLHKLEEFAKNKLEKSSFGSTDIKDNPLVEWADEIEMCGIATNVCVLSNAVILKNFKSEKVISIIESLCASFEKDLHDAAIKVMKSMGIKII